MEEGNQQPPLAHQMALPPITALLPLAQNVVNTLNARGIDVAANINNGDALAPEDVDNANNTLKCVEIEMNRPAGTWLLQFKHANWYLLGLFVGGLPEVDQELAYAAQVRRMGVLMNRMYLGSYI